MKCFVTNVTFVGFFARVGKPVVFVVALLVETLAAKFARPWPVAEMNSHVSVEGGAAVEGLSACLTFVRFVVGVNDFVAAKRRGLTEAFTTDFANKGSCT